jgi:hypothetical protein
VEATVMKKIFILFLLFGFQISLQAQVETSLYGNSGLINIPTAQIASDGQVSFGTGYIPKPYAIIDSPVRDNQVYFVTVGYLPFLEITFGTMRIVNEIWGIGDRTASFRFRILDEKRYIPQLTAGVHDPFGLVAEDWAQHLAASYLVGSKSVQIHPVQLRTHLGFGTKWLNAAHYRLSGFFGGMDIKYKFLSLMGEYDSKNFNCGARISILSHFSFLITWLECKKATGGCNFSFNL